MSSEVLDANDSIAVCDRGSNLNSILGTAKDCARAVSHPLLPFGVRHPDYDLRTLDHGQLSRVLSLMIAAGGVESLPARTAWPMHRALWVLDTEVRRSGLRHALGGQLEFTPSPESGLAARGADEAFRILARNGLLAARGSVLTARWIVVPQRSVDARRELMTLDPSFVQLLQRAGSRWAALASTVAKNLPAEVESPGSTLASGTV